MWQQAILTWSSGHPRGSSQGRQAEPLPGRVLERRRQAPLLQAEVRQQARAERCLQAEGMPHRGHTLQEAMLPATIWLCTRLHEANMEFRSMAPSNTTDVETLVVAVTSSVEASLPHFQDALHS